MEQLNELLLFGFQLGFWLTNLSCLIGLVARKIFYLVVGIMKPTN
nr:MAG TPA: protein of unknown function (DUF4212) [Inoviridae sp.]